MSPGIESSPLSSFWMAGFEGADHVNVHGESLDMVGLAGHDAQVCADYRRLASLGIRIVRESIGWRLAEPRGGGRFDFDRAVRFAMAAENHRLQIAWTFMHYGTPPDVSLMNDAFCDRFVDFAAAAARALRPFSPSPPVYTLINEISFLAWAACETNLIHPYIGDRSDSRHVPLADGFEVKARLVRATIKAMAAIRSEDPRARFLNVDPLVHVVAPPDASPELADEAVRFRQFQWQVCDMLSGQLLPELGGSQEGLDLVGVNYYHSGQWEYGTGSALDWERDTRRLPFSDLLVETWERYRRPIVVSETGHVGGARARWLQDVYREVDLASRRGVPIQGLCLYPAVDRPDWNDTSAWHRSGIWDAAPPFFEPALCPRSASASPGRYLDAAYDATLARCQHARLAHPMTSHRGNAMKKTLLVFCHLRWDFVFQRPQHLLSRLADDYDVLVVEEPLHHDAPARLEATSVLPGVTVIRPLTPLKSRGFQDDQLSLLGPLMADYMATRGTAPYIVLLYTAMAVPILSWLRPEALIYDCMDELSAFAGAPIQLRELETELLAAADLVLTGGPSLFAAKRGLNPNVLCLPSSVDAKHFAPAPHAADDPYVLRASSLQDLILEPRLGYFGVIDERMDLVLVEKLADAHPTWQIVMVGPVVKIDPQSLPRRPNIHWLGQQPYEILPHLIAGWQAGLLPFALNDSTQFISPTKTLEYMAAGKPAISTAVKDVITLYGDVVLVAGSHDEFIVHCATVLGESSADKRTRALAMRATVANSSWDRSAQIVHAAITAIPHQVRAAGA